MANNDFLKLIFPLKCNVYYSKLSRPNRMHLLRLISKGYPVLYDNFIIIKCKEHKCKELIPTLNYYYDLYPWYKSGLHPRFSLMRIILSFKELQKYSLAIDMLEFLKGKLYSNITEDEVKKIIKNKIQEEKQKEKEILQKNTLRNLKRFLGKNQKYANIIWSKLSPKQQKQFIKETEILSQDDSTIIFSYNDRLWYATKKNIRIIDMSRVVVDELIKLGANTQEIIQISRLRFWSSRDLLLRYVRNQITIYDFFNEPNHEVRRHLLRKLDANEIIKKLQFITKDNIGELYKDPNHNFYYLVVKDPSTNELYLLSVPNNIKTPMEAKNWTFRFSNDKIVEWVKET